MLILSRKLGEKVCIGLNVTVTVLAVKGNQVRIGIDAPAAVTALRSELAGRRPGAGASGPDAGFHSEDAPRASR